MHPYLTPATRSMVINAGLEMEAEFWTHQASTWACVHTQFKNMVIALDQHGLTITPSMASNPPQHVLDFEQLALQPLSKLTVHQAAHQLGWVQPAFNRCCWWGRAAGSNFCYGGLPPSVALNAHIVRQVQKTTSNTLRIPWWGAGIAFDKIQQIQLEARSHFNI